MSGGSDNNQGGPPFDNPGQDNTQLGGSASSGGGANGLEVGIIITVIVMFIVVVAMLFAWRARHNSASATKVYSHPQVPPKPLLAYRRDSVATPAPDDGGENGLRRPDALVTTDHHGMAAAHAQMVGGENGLRRPPRLGSTSRDTPSTPAAPIGMGAGLFNSTSVAMKPMAPVDPAQLQKQLPPKTHSFGKGTSSLPRRENVEEHEIETRA